MSRRRSRSLRSGISMDRESGATHRAKKRSTASRPPYQPGHRDLQSSSRSARSDGDLTHTSPPLTQTDTVGLSGDSIRIVVAIPQPYPCPRQQPPGEAERSSSTDQRTGRDSGGIPCRGADASRTANRTRSVQGTRCFRTRGRARGPRLPPVLKPACRCRHRQVDRCSRGLGGRGQCVLLGPLGK